MSIFYPLLFSIVEHSDTGGQTLKCYDSAIKPKIHFQSRFRTNVTIQSPILFSYASLHPSPLIKWKQVSVHILIFFPHRNVASKPQQNHELEFHRVKHVWKDYLVTWAKVILLNMKLESSKQPSVLFAIQLQEYN